MCFNDAYSLNMYHLLVFSVFVFNPLRDKPKLISKYWTLYDDDDDYRIVVCYQIKVNEKALLEK